MARLVGSSHEGFFKRPPPVQSGRRRGGEEERRRNERGWGGAGRRTCARPCGSQSASLFSDARFALRQIFGSVRQRRRFGEGRRGTWDGGLKHATAGRLGQATNHAIQVGLELRHGFRPHAPSTTATVFTHPPHGLSSSSRSYVRSTFQDSFLRPLEANWAHHKPYLMALSLGLSSLIRTCPPLGI